MISRFWQATMLRAAFMGADSKKQNEPASKIVQAAGAGLGRRRRQITTAGPDSA